VNRLNNVDLGTIQSFGEEIKKNPAKARRDQVLEGEWIINGKQVQFHSPIQFQGGKTTFEADIPAFMGGGGSLPGPMHHCLFGLASCHTGVFATMAAWWSI